MSLLRTTARALVCIALASALAPSLAQAQAWVPTELSLGMTLEYSFVFWNSDVRPGHRPADDIRTPDDPTPTRYTGPAAGNSHVIIPTIDFTPYDSIGLKLALPLIATKFTDEPASTHPHPQMYNVDDGSMHFNVQDLNLEARYMIDIPDVITFAPHIGTSFPVTDYPTVGHAMPGRGRPQLRAGLSVGRALSEVIPGAYFHGRYQFAYVLPLTENGCPSPCTADTPVTGERPAETEEEKALAKQVLEQFKIHRSMIDFELGYFLFEDLSIRLTTHYEWTHDGFEYGDTDAVKTDPRTGMEDGPASDLDRIVNQNHDVLGKEEYFLLGGGLTYILMEEVFISATFLKWLGGANTHDSDSLSVAVSYTFF
jgi:hypothetical protein